METKQATTVVVDKSNRSRRPDFKSFDGRYSAWFNQSKSGNQMVDVVDNWKKDEGHPNPIIRLIETVK